MLSEAQHEHVYNYDLSADVMRCACGATSAPAGAASSICGSGSNWSRDPHTSLVAALLESKAALIAYLQSKIKQGDWHAVQDAASDIREIEAKLTLVREL